MKKPILLFLITAWASTAYAQPGTLDTSFSADGIQTTAIGSYSDVGHSVRQQADGKLVVAGFSNNGANGDFAIARYLAGVLPGIKEPASGSRQLKIIPNPNDGTFIIEMNNATI